METVGFLCIFPFLGWIYYRLQKRIGKNQSIEWKEYVDANPKLFRKPDSISPIRGMTEEQKKYVEAMWERYRQRKQHIENEKLNESKNNIREKR